jgi:Transglycosylase SLT domain
VIVIDRPEKSVIPLFDRMQHHSSVPTIFVAAVARSGSPGRPLGRRDSASPLTAASTMARLRPLGATMCIVVIIASFALWGSAVSAKRLSSPPHRAGVAILAPFAAFVTEASLRFGVPEHWIRAVMRVESAGDIRARSRKGAMGLTQIMPETWIELRAHYNLGTDPYDPHDNILAGAAYLREMHDRYGAPGFLAAYNAGPGRYERHLAPGRPLPDETQAYVATLAPMIGGRQVERQVAAADSSNWQRATLFVARGENLSTDDRRSPDMQSRRPLSVHAVVDLSAFVPQSHNLFVRRTGEVRSQ